MQTDASMGGFRGGQGGEVGAACVYGGLSPDFLKNNLKKYSTSTIVE